MSYHAVEPDKSVGLYPNAVDGYRVVFEVPTPRAPNVASFSSALKINEWMALNRASLMDPTEQRFDDWLELHNRGSNWLDLTGYTLSDNLTNVNQWKFPAGTTLPAGGYLSLWADEDDADTGLHASFRLAASGEEIALFAPDGQLVDHVLFGEQNADVSAGRLPDSGPNTGPLPAPTPGYSNSAFGPLLDVNDATVTEGGTVVARFAVMLNAATANTVKVNFATANGSAVAGLDYFATCKITRLHSASPSRISAPA